jgi:hypothetical protein
MSTHNSNQPPGGHSHGQPHGLHIGPGPGTGPDQDHIDFGKVITVGVVSLVIFAISSYWAWTILRGERKELATRGEPHIATQAGQPEIGIVDQVPFAHDNRLEVWRAERTHWLNSYGWVDKKPGPVHIPIDKAIDALLSGATPPAPPPSLSPPPAGGAEHR